MCLRPGGNRLHDSADLAWTPSHTWGPLGALTGVVWPRQGKPRQHSFSSLVSHSCLLVLASSHGGNRDTEHSGNTRPEGLYLEQVGSTSAAFCWPKNVTLQLRLKRWEEELESHMAKGPWMHLISFKYLLCAEHCFGSMRVNSHVPALGFSNLMSILDHPLGWKVKFWLMREFLVVFLIHAGHIFFTLCCSFIPLWLAIGNSSLKWRAKTLWDFFQ